MIQNDAHLYSKMVATNEGFIKCSELNPAHQLDNILTALCITPQENSVEAHYMPNADERGWNYSATFVFEFKAENLTMNQIILALKEGTKAFVEGI